MNQKLALQAAVSLAGLVPVTAGTLGAIDPRWLALAGAAPTLTHAAYLSGLLLGIGLAFWSLVPGIERQGRVFTVLSAIVALGGLARLWMAVHMGAGGASVVLPLVMELGVTPALWAWQRRVARSFNSPPE